MRTTHTYSCSAQRQQQQPLLRYTLSYTVTWRLVVVVVVGREKWSLNAGFTTMDQDQQPSTSASARALDQQPSTSAATVEAPAAPVLGPNPRPPESLVPLRSISLLPGNLSDPALHIAPVFRNILLAVKGDLADLIRWRTLSPKWEEMVVEALQAQMSLKIFSCFKALKEYMEQLNKYGLREDAFYKLSQTDPDELVGRAPVSSGQSTGTHLPTLLTNVQKLIIADANDPRNLDLAPILSQWTATLQSLVIFRLPDLKVGGLGSWSSALGQMANLTRLELYDVYLNHIEVEKMAAVLGRLEHFTVADKEDAVYMPEVDYVGQLKVLLGALRPGKLHHLGLILRLQTYFTIFNLYELFIDWKHGRQLLSNLSRLQLGLMSLEALQVIVERCPGLKYLSFTPACVVPDCSTEEGTSYCYRHAPMGLVETLEALVPLGALVHLQLNYMRNWPTTQLLPLDSAIVPLTSIRHLSFTVPSLHHLPPNFTNKIPENISTLIRSYFPNLQQLHLSDSRWNIVSYNCRIVATALTTLLPRGSAFSWSDDYRNYFPVRFWPRLPAQCRDLRCSSDPVHYTQSTYCNVEIERKRAEAKERESVRLKIHAKKMCQEAAKVRPLTASEVQDRAEELRQSRAEDLGRILAEKGRKAKGEKRKKGLSG